MKKIIITDWQKHGDYMLFAGIVDKHELGVILQTSGSHIMVFGIPEQVEVYERELKKMKISYREE